MATTYIALPKGVSEKTFDAAVNDFRRLLGEANVLTSAEQLAPYIKTMMPVPEAGHVPSAAILATKSWATWSRATGRPGAGRRARAATGAPRLAP